MNRLFLDTNVIIDLLAAREPFYEAIARLVTLADQKEIEIVASPNSFTTAHYILSKFEAREKVTEKLRRFSIICRISNIDAIVVDKALNSGFSDFEDAVQYFCAVAANANLIITRNGKDFKHSELPFMTAEEYLKSRGNNG